MICARSSRCEDMRSNQRRMTVARSLAVRAFHPGSAASAAAIARRVSEAPMLGMEPTVAPVAGFFTAKMPPLSAATQLPSIKHRSRSNSGSASFIAMTPLALSAFENGRDAHAPGSTDRDESAPGCVYFQNFRQRGHDARAGRRERVADCEAAALYIEFRSIDAAKGAGQAEFIPTESRICPGFQRTQHLSGEGLVYLVEIKVLQRQLGVAQHSRNRVRRSHHQAFLFIDVVDRRHLAVTQECQHREIARSGPRFGREQY